MKIKYLFTSVAIASALAACGGESSEKSAPIIVPTAAPTAIPTAGPTNEPGDGDIIQTALPVVEDFEGAADVYDLFSEDYKTLATDQSGLATDVNAKAGGINNFYYSIAGLFSDQEVNYNDKVATDTWLTTDTGNQALRLGNSRFTLAQTSSDLASPSSAWFDQRQKSSPGSAESGVSWGELDLTGDYSISFCLIEAGGNDDKKMFVFIDNNQSSKGSSTHGDNSQAYSMPISELKNLVGQRITIEPTVGTANSYIQMRAEGDAWFVIDDLVIEDAAHPAGSVDDCSTKTTAWGDTNPNPPVLEPTTEPTAEPTVEPTIEPAPPATNLASSAVWGAYSVDLKPTEVDSITVDGVTTAFDEGGSDVSNDFWTIASGIGTFDTTAGGVKPYSDYGPIVGDAFRKTFTLTTRMANPNALSKSFEIEMAFGGSEQLAGESEALAGRLKFMLRDSRILFEKFGGDGADSQWDYPSDFDVTAFHDYQLQVILTGPRAAELWLYVDGELVHYDITATLRSTTADRNEIRIGENGSSDYHAQMDWMVWTSTDAYSAAELVDNLPDLNLGNTSGYESGAVAPAILAEDFSAADTATFMSEAYKALPGDATTPMYEATSGESRIAVGSGQLAMTNARFTIGNSDNSVTTADGVDPVGALDLSAPYTISFTVVDFTDDADAVNDAGKFQLYVDNNTTSSGNSVHQGASKVLEIAFGDGTITTLPHTVTLPLSVGTATSFLQFRADSRVGNLIIDDLSIELQ